MKISDLQQSLADLVQAHFEGESVVNKIISHPDALNFRTPTGTSIYRLWTISPTRFRKIMSGSVIELPKRRNFISYSWSIDGAKFVETEGYEHSGVRVIIKKKLLPNTLLFNLHQFAGYVKEQGGVHLPSRVWFEYKLMLVEEELLIKDDSYYRTISKSDILWYKE
jgi:hypothetical protein